MRTCPRWDRQHVYKKSQIWPRCFLKCQSLVSHKKWTRFSFRRGSRKYPENENCHASYWKKITNISHSLFTFLNSWTVYQRIPPRVNEARHQSAVIDRVAMGLLPATQICGLRMRRECRERFPHPPTSNETVIQRSRHASRHVRHARAVMHVGIAYLWWRGKRSRHSRRMRTRNLTYLARGPLSTCFRIPYRRCSQIATEKPSIIFVPNDLRYMRIVLQYEYHCGRLCRVWSDKIIVVNYYANHVAKSEINADILSSVQSSWSLSKLWLKLKFNLKSLYTSIGLENYG